MSDKKSPDPLAYLGREPSGALPGQPNVRRYQKQELLDAERRNPVPYPRSEIPDPGPSCFFEHTLKTPPGQRSSLGELESK